jgi:hypothetical protein
MIPETPCAAPIYSLSCHLYINGDFEPDSLAYFSPDLIIASNI